MPVGALGEHLLVEPTDMIDEISNRREEVVADLGAGRGELGFRDLEPFRPDIDTVKRVQRAAHGVVTVRPHVVDDAPNRGT